MGNVPAGTGHPARQLADHAHDLRSGLSAAAAYLDLARERLAQGEAVTAEDLDLVERGLRRVDAAVQQLDADAKAAKLARKEGPR